MAKRKKTVRRKASFSNKEPEFDPKNYRASLRDMLDYARTYATPATIRKWSKAYLGNSEYSKISGATDYELFYIGALGRLKTNGVELRDLEENHLETRLAALKEQYKPVKKEKEEPTAPKISIQEKMDNLADAMSETIDLEIDKFLETKSWDFDTVAWVETNQISPQVAKRIADRVREESRELALVSLKKEEELLEGYENFSQAQAKKLVKGLMGTINTLEGVQPKARKTKPRTPGTIAKKVNYQKTEDSLGLKSIHPEKIVGSKEVWLYNTKKRKLSVYRGDLSVKGTSIVGYDDSKSKMKTIRKPDEFFQDLGTGKREISKRFKELSGKELPSRPRINKDTIILRVFS